MYFLCNKKCCTFLFSVPMGVLFLWETGGTSRILKRNYRCCIGGAVTWRLQRGTAAIKWALLSAPWRSVEFCLNHVPSFNISNKEIQFSMIFQNGFKVERKNKLWQKPQKKKYRMLMIVTIIFLASKLEETLQ